METAVKYQQRLIFITGASRSGTTLLSFVLRKHTDIFGLKETQYFGQFSTPSNFNKKLKEKQLIEVAATLYARQARGPGEPRPVATDYRKAREFITGLSDKDQTGPGIYAAVVSTMGADDGKLIVCEQTPRNIYYAEDLLKVYPNAHVVHMMRDPRGVLSSQKKRWQRRKLTAKRMSYMEMFRVWINYHPFTMAKLWNIASGAALKLLNHPRFCLLRFEDLVQYPEKSVQKLCQFLDIEYQEQIIDVSQVNSSFYSETEAPKGFNIKTTEAWLKILNKNEIAICEQLSGSLMKKFGYKPTREEKLPLLADLLYLLSYPLHVLGVLIANPHRAYIQLQALLGIR